MIKHKEYLLQALTEIRNWRKHVPEAGQYPTEFYEQLVKHIEYARECELAEEVGVQLQLIARYLTDAGAPPKEVAPSLYYAIALCPVSWSQSDNPLSQSAIEQPDFFRRIALLLVRFTGVVMAILGVQGLVYTIFSWCAQWNAKEEVVQAYNTGFWSSLFWSITGTVMVWQSRRLAAFIARTNKREE